MKKTVVISLGGSIVFPDSINKDYLAEFKDLVETYINRNYRFVIIVGGGAPCRRNQAKAREENPSITAEELDQVGIETTWENAEQVREYFGEVAHKEIVKEYDQAVEFEHVLIGGGWKPGHSTDYDAVKSAELYGADRVINISSADYLYTKHPDEEGAERIKQATWEQLQEIVGMEWSPGAHTPFDPKATKLGGELHIRLFMVGKDLSNLKNVFDGEEFKGTLVKNKKMC